MNKLQFGSSLPHHYSAALERKTEVELYCQVDSCTDGPIQFNVVTSTLDLMVGNY